MNQSFQIYLIQATILILLPQVISGNVDCASLISQMKSQMKSAGQTETEDMDRAWQMQEEFFKKCIIPCLIGCALDAESGDEEAAQRRKKKFCEDIDCKHVLSQLKSAVHDVKGAINMQEIGSLKYILPVAGLFIGPAAVAYGISTLGFGGGGIVAKSLAAKFMATYGGAVPWGSVCAILQSIGAAGMSTGLAGGSALAGAAAGAKMGEA